MAWWPTVFPVPSVLAVPTADGRPGVERWWRATPTFLSRAFSISGVCPRSHVWHCSTALHANSVAVARWGALS
eukprot:103050-Alexandrium_andersonii.AAC.1